MVKFIHQIRTTEDFFEQIQLSHFDDLAPALLVAIQDVQMVRFGQLVSATSPTLLHIEPDVPMSSYETIQWVENETPGGVINPGTPTPHSQVRTL